MPYFHALLFMPYFHALLWEVGREVGHEVGHGDREVGHGDRRACPTFPCPTSMRHFPAVGHGSERGECVWIL